MSDMSGAVALVTGAGQGVGREIALAMAASGAEAVVVNDVDLQRAERVADEIRAAGGQAMAVGADVTDHEAVTEMVARSATFGPVNVLVNNAGNGGANPDEIDEGSFWTVRPQSWRPYVDVNLYGPMNCAHAVLPGMIQQGLGRIVTIISDAGRVGEPGLEAYSAAKAGAAGFTRAVAKAVGRHGVTANNVAIAATRTPTTAAVLQDEARVRKMFATYVVRRPGEPSDVAPVVLLLASPATSWITGQTYPVNGGYSFAL